MTVSYCILVVLDLKKSHTLKPEGEEMFSLLGSSVWACQQFSISREQQVSQGHGQFLPLFSMVWVVMTTTPYSTGFGDNAFFSFQKASK